MEQEKNFGERSDKEAEINSSEFPLGGVLKKEAVGQAMGTGKFNNYDESVERLLQAIFGQDVFEREEKEPTYKKEPESSLEEPKSQPAERRMNEEEKEAAARLAELGQELDKLYVEQFLVLEAEKPISSELVEKINTAEEAIWGIFRKKYPLMTNSDLNAKLKPIFNKKKERAQELAKIKKNRENIN